LQAETHESAPTCAGFARSGSGELTEILVQFETLAKAEKSRRSLPGLLDDIN
jgi:hypothetical protein